MFKKSFKLNFDVKNKPCVVWSDRKNRITLTTQDNLIIEELFYSPMYDDRIWVHIPNENERANVLEKAYGKLLKDLGNMV